MSILLLFNLYYYHQFVGSCTSLTKSENFIILLLLKYYCMKLLLDDILQ